MLNSEATTRKIEAHHLAREACLYVPAVLSAPGQGEHREREARICEALLVMLAELAPSPDADSTNHEGLLEHRVAVSRLDLAAFPTRS